MPRSTIRSGLRTPVCVLAEVERGRAGGRGRRRRAGGRRVRRPRGRRRRARRARRIRGRGAGASLVSVRRAAARRGAVSMRWPWSCGRRRAACARTGARVRHELERLERDRDVLLADAEESADADDERDHLTLLVDQDVVDVANVLIVRAIDARAADVGRHHLVGTGRRKRLVDSLEAVVERVVALDGLRRLSRGRLAGGPRGSSLSRVDGEPVVDWLVVVDEPGALEPLAERTRSGRACGLACRRTILRGAWGADGPGGSACRWRRWSRRTRAMMATSSSARKRALRAELSPGDKQDACSSWRSPWEKGASCRRLALAEC